MEWPILWRLNRIHLLWFCKPLVDRKLFGILRPRALKSSVFEEELGHLPMPGLCSIAVSFQISVSQWTNPAPVSSKHLIATNNDLRGCRLASEEGPGECGDKQRIWHDRRQKSAPTSPAMREPVCVDAQ